MTRLLLAAVLVLLGACSGSNNETVPGHAARSVAQANIVTAGDQQNPAVALNDRGDAVVVWESSDGNHLGIFGRRFRLGQPVGPEFRVNTYSASRQNFPTVAMDGAGNFTVAWRSSRQSGEGGSIWAQRYGADGARQGGEFQVSDAASSQDSQSEPAAAMNERGDLVIAWGDRELSALATAAGLNTLEDRYIEARIYAPDGSARGEPFEVTHAMLAVVRAPGAAIDADGNFVLSWISEGSPSGVRARRYDADGQALGPVFTVSAPAAGVGFDLPQIAMSPAGSFVVAWETDFLDATPDGIDAQRYGADGTALGTVFSIGNQLGGLRERAAVAMDAAGRFTVVGQNRDGGIYARRFDAAGAPLGGIERLDGGAFFAMFPALALDSNGQALVAWQSFRQDGDGRGVYLQFGTPP